MPIIDVSQTNFSDGISQNSKNWLPYSARFSRNIEIFEDSDYVTLKPIPIKDSGAVVTDLVKWIVDANPYANVRYALGDSGNIYKIASNVWTLDHTISGGSPAGQGLVVLDDALYYMNSTTIGRLYPLSNSPTYNDNFFSDGVLNLDASVTASGNTYTTPAAISESATDLLSYQPAFDPLTSMQLFVTTKGTGNWTVTLHDSNNVALGTATVANGSLTNGQMNTFTFSSPIRIWIGKIYHFHVTSTVADGTLQTGTSSNFSTAQYKTFFGILVADSDFHPAIQHTNGVGGTIEIGNEHYIAQWDGSTYNPNKIQLMPGFKVRSQAAINENTVHFTWKGANIDSFEYGMAFIWDGSQPYYNYSRPITQGSPNAVTTSKNRLFGIFGSNGDMELAPDESSPFILLQNAPKLSRGAKAEVLPGAIGVWENRIHWGYSNTDDAGAAAYNDTNAGNHVSGDTYTPPVGLEQGIYEFGNQSDRTISYTDVSTEALNFAFQPSTVIANPLSFKIGCFFPVGRDAYVSYKDGSSYYVDRITKGNNPVPTGSWESLIVDKDIDKAGQMKQMTAKQKLGWRVGVSCVALPTGCTLTAKYRINRAAPWTFGQTVTAGASYAVANLLGVGGGKYNEVEYGFDVTATVNYPVITFAGIFFETLMGELDG